MKTKTTIISALVIFLVAAIFWPRGESVQSYRERLIGDVNQELFRSDNPVRKKIENAHMTVTAKSAKVTACTVRAVDGSNKAGRNGSNIGDVDLVITVIWDGWIQKDGYTEFEVLYDTQNKIIKETKYLRSSAMINLDTVDWVGVGIVIGQYVAAASL